MKVEPGGGPGAFSAAARRRWYPVLAVLGAAFLVIAAVYVPVKLTSTSSYCTSCHEMRAAGASWKQSVHGQVSCVVCHINPGLSNEIVWRLQEAKNIYATYLNAKGMTSSVQLPSNAACTQPSCHVLSQLKESFPNLRMPHRSHVLMRNLSCIDCHNGVAHGTGATATQVSMQRCFMCHNGAAAPNRCGLCHIATPKTTSHPADFMEEHGSLALGHEQDCYRCHHDPKAFCDACHARPTPPHFSGTWRYTHGSAAKADTAGCLGCHDYQSFCRQCHQVDHPADWIAKHGLVAVKGSESCLVCHPRTMCTTCHDQRGVRVP